MAEKQYDDETKKKRDEQQKTFWEEAKKQNIKNYTGTKD
jgi:hypothetical protein